MQIHPVPEFTFYGVDNQGNIYRIKGRTGKPLEKPKRIKPVLNKKLGYHVLSLYDGSGRNPNIRYLHHVVASVWLGPKPPGHHVHHKDEDKLNNHPSNLVYVEAVSHREMHSPLSERAARKILLSDKTAKELAAENGCSRSSIYNVWGGRTYRRVFEELRAAGKLKCRRGRK